ncbi:MAG TPA: hypothetical protein VGB85_23285 [Nannocystis sp.]|jgi:hypothetical protein
MPTLSVRPLACALLLTACPGDGGTGDTGSTGSTITSASTVEPTSTPTTGTGATDTSATDTSATDGTATQATGDATTLPATDTSATTTDGLDTGSTGATGTSGTTTDASTTDASTTETGTTGPQEASEIEVVITADNAYGFAYGTETDIAKYYGGLEAVTAGQIFNCGEGPETYVIPAQEAEGATHLYIIAWADSAVTQGVLARFRRLGGGGGFGEDVFTGTKGWEVCATGIDYEPGDGGPPLAQINEYIGKCNGGLLDPNTTSVGWVDEIGTQYGSVAFGEDNTTPYEGGSPQPGNEFQLVCPDVMPAEAHWMWFNWANLKPPESPFLWPGEDGNPDHQFLIFRLAAELLPEPQ